MPALCPTEITVCEHAAQRWAERVRHDPTMSVQAAREDLQRCAAAGELTCNAPRWLAVDASEPGARYLLLGPDVAVVLRGIAAQHLAAVTVMTPHDRGAVHAARCRNRRRARHRSTGARRPSRSYA